ncbi:MAG: hypothetical protein R3F56_12935 [Planctomycetota bacterium]
MAVRQAAVGTLAAALLGAAYALLRTPTGPAALDTAPPAAPDSGRLEPLGGLRTAADDDGDVVRARIEPAGSGSPEAGDAGFARRPPPARTVQAWVEDLRDDDIAGNAGIAMRRLREAGTAAVAALESALVSRDRQQRHLAAEVLRGLDVAPSAGLCAVSVEALAREMNDALTSTILAPTAVSATRYLASHAQAARDALRFGLGASDDQQRFLCAFLLACGGEPGDVQRVTRELVVHLADNHIRGDAVMAAHGLFRMGAGVRPLLQAWMPHVDEQARSILRLVDEDFAEDFRASGGPRPPFRGSRLPRVTRVYVDPAVHYDVRRSRVPTW